MTKSEKRELLRRKGLVKESAGSVLRPEESLCQEKLVKEVGFYDGSERMRELWMVCSESKEDVDW